MEAKPIEIENLSVHFGRICALKNVSFSVEEGEFVTIIGPNGGGKTTLLHAIVGLLEPTTGKVRLFGKKPKDLPFHYISFVPQIKTLDRNFPAKAIELVATGLNGRWKFLLTKTEWQECLSAMEKVGVAHLANQSLQTLSGGELQRVYLARSFIRKPKILIFDEPLTGVDEQAEYDFIQILEEYIRRNNVTVIMTTHDWEYSFHHSHRAMLLNKEMIAFDLPKKVFTESNLQRAFGHIGHSHSMQFIVSKDD